MIKFLDQIVMYIYPWMPLLKLPQIYSVAILLIITAFTSLLSIILLMRRSSGPSKPVSEPNPTISKADRQKLNQQVAARSDLTEAQNARFLAEKAELYRLIGKVFRDATPASHKDAVMMLDLYEQMFILIEEAMQEGSAEWQSKITEKNPSIFDYLVELVESALSSNHFYMKINQLNLANEFMYKAIRSHSTTTSRLASLLLVSTKSSMPALINTNLQKS